ncbi:MAG TPA: DEAD/DEAH box helicase, partial [Polyangiales bacterium]|nr:DEAD/DEAH box helicase [Polyangiales bacterium]
FALPILHRLMAEPREKGKRKIRVLVLAPTRELASQIGASFAAYGRNAAISGTVAYGGVNINRQIDALAHGVDVLVATPGRLIDLLDRNALTLAHVHTFVLDEADHMLDMGFIHDVRRIAAKVPKRRQTLLLSATMPPAIRQLGMSLLSNPAEVAVTPVASTAETVEQSLCFVEKSDKPRLLIWALQDPENDRALVFTRTKHGANRVTEQLGRAGIRAAPIHGNKSQAARERALARFKANELRVLVATDVAARGIDIDGLSLVVNYDLPNVPEFYVHRIGRTGRAGSTGKALSFCDREERPFLRDIERLIGKPVPVIDDHPYRPNGAQRQSASPEPRTESRGQGRARQSPPQPASLPPSTGNRVKRKYRA